MNYDITGPINQAKKGKYLCLYFDWVLRFNFTDTCHN